MILAIDIGNTTIALGGLRDGKVCFVAHIDTVREGTVAHYTAALKNAFAKRRYPDRPLRFEGVVLTSVVPSITQVLAECAGKYTNRKPLVIGPDIRTGFTMGVKNPAAVGKDRLADAAFAVANFPLPVITVDLGTATTFSVVDEQLVFLGGAIAPGLSTGLRALNERCAQLPNVRLAAPKQVIGDDTAACMLTGSIIGAAALIDGMAQRMETELGKPCSLVITGGLAKYVVPYCNHALTYDPQLMMKGLGLLYELNR
ncbi:MAG: type III pantothenate kinase [Faecalibacterium sp.]